MFFQARDEVIDILRAEQIDLALLEAQYGFVTPKKVLEALQRDAFQAKSAPWQEDIYEKPMDEVSTTPGIGAQKAEAHCQPRAWANRVIVACTSVQFFTISRSDALKTYPDLHHTLHVLWWRKMNESQETSIFLCFLFLTITLKHKMEELTSAQTLQACAFLLGLDGYPDYNKEQTQFNYQG